MANNSAGKKYYTAKQPRRRSTTAGGFSHLHRPKSSLGGSSRNKSAAQAYYADRGQELIKDASVTESTVDKGVAVVRVGTDGKYTDTALRAETVRSYFDSGYTGLRIHATKKAVELTTAEITQAVGRGYLTAAEQNAITFELEDTVEEPEAVEASEPEAVEAEEAVEASEPEVAELESDVEGSEAEDVEAAEDDPVLEALMQEEDSDEEDSDEEDSDE